MSKYIEADSLKEAMKTYGFHSADQTITEFVEDILPTADVIKVVRCKDCEYWQTDWIPNHGGDRGCHYCEMMDTFTEPLNYCGDAERKILPKD